MQAAWKAMSKRRKDILAYFDTKSMHPKTGRATKRGYFEGFFSELHTKSLPNRPFEQIWCEVPPFRGWTG
ncbi:transposase [Corynebacterium diphtheriae]|nr:transposase [Corynebacterium diphtheriae]